MFILCEKRCSHFESRKRNGEGIFTLGQNYLCLLFPYLTHTGLKLDPAPSEKLGHAVEFLICSYIVYKQRKNISTAYSISYNKRQSFRSSNLFF